MLKIGNMYIESKNTFEFCVSEYSTAALYKAEHTNELVKDGFIHLFLKNKIDTKNNK